MLATPISQEKISKNTSTPSTTNLQKNLRFYHEKLLGVKLRNRSILLRQISDKWCFDFSGFDSSKRVVDHSLVDKKSICIIPNSEKSKWADSERTKLRSLYRNITQIQRETGLQETYLGFPFVEGHISKRWYVRGPLVLFPVSIIYKNEGKLPGWYLSFSKDKDPILNRALMEAIKREGGLGLPETFTDEFEDLLDKITKEIESKSNEKEAAKAAESLFLKGLTNLLLENKAPLDLNNYNIDKIDILNKIDVVGGRISIDDKRSWIENEKLHLVNYKVIGNFPQGKNAIYLDYEELVKKARSDDDLGVIKKLLSNVPPDSIDINPPEQTNYGKESEPLNLDDNPMDKLNLAVPSDASQDVVVLASQSSQCTVVRGPPGTGKSQVIVNLISNALANSQKVLLVCQKRAALDIVYQRLDKLGVSRYIAFLHDAVSGRPSLYNRLASILESEVSCDDITIINSKLKYYSHEINKIIGRQARIADALKNRDLAGITVNKLYVLMSKPDYIPKLDLSKVARQITYHALPVILDNISRLEESSKKFDTPESVWFWRKDFANFSYLDKANFINILDKLTELSKDGYVVFMDSIYNQKILIESLETIATNSSGIKFRNFLPGGKVRTARDNAKRLLGSLKIQCDDSNINDLRGTAKRGFEIWEAINNLLSFMNEDGIYELTKGISTGQIDLFHSQLVKIKEGLITEFDELQEHDIRKARLTSKEKEILDLCTTKLSSEMDWKDILEQEFYVHWIDYIEHEYPELKGHAFDTYIHNRDQLSKLVKEHREIVVQRVASQINSSIIRPDITSGLSHAYKEHDDLWSALLDELNKKKHILPVRKLIEHYEPTILKISPCWLATPSAVSSIFPLKRNIFDLIIFDEASQSPVADSLTSLYRGKKVVIIGDEKQLRPSDLFELKEDEYEVDGDIDRTLLSESLLTLANRAFNYTYLRWHYRSAFQELIDFSNHAFYEGRLKIAPNILRGVTPIRWIACGDGVWLDRKNVPEAIRVVDELKGIFITNKINGTNRSIGIITFNYQQRVEIENEIDRRRQKDLEFDKLYSEIDDPETRNLDDLPFVKNIENVQGDERDIIIFSLGYAKDLENPEDTIGVQFGSLNRQDGENRLNVAITRARQEIVILCSFDPYRIKADDAQYDGPKRLKDYLCYAKSISESNIENTRKILSSLDRSKNSESFSPLFDEKSLEVLVREKLQKLGYQVDLKVGYSDYKIDLAVVHPDNPSKYILAIETDGESFTSANSTIERDIIRQDFLESRGWRVERIWSRNWWRNSDEEMRRIQQKIEEIRHSDNSIANEKSNNTTSQSTIREILSTEQKFEESSSSITPQTPFSNKVRYRKALESCEGYIHWIDKWFSAYGLEILSDCNIKNINEIKILTSDLRVDTKLRDTIIDFSKEFKNRGIVCEMRVLNNREIYRALHDRWILSKNICFNLPSPDIVARGQYSEIKQTTSRPPFEQWWINSLDIVTDWNEIARMILDRRQKDG